MSAISAYQHMPQTSVISAVVGVAVELQAIHKQQFVRSAEIERSAEKAAERQDQRDSIKGGSFTLELSKEAQSVARAAPVAAASESASTNPETGGNVDISA